MTARSRRSVGLAARRRIHDLLPVLPVAIGDEHRDRRAERFAGANAGEKLDGVLFDLHAPAAAVPLLTARELGVDVRGEQRQARGHPFENAHEGGPMRFAGGREAEGHACILAPHPPAPRPRVAARPPCNYGPGLMSVAVRSMTTSPCWLTAKILRITSGASPGIGNDTRSGP